MTQKISADPGVRCPGHHDRGDHTSFQCVLDAGHAGYCQPYRAPDVDEWRAMKARLANAESRADRWSREAGSLRAELFVVRTAYEGTDRGIDAAVVAGVQAGRDNSQPKGK